MGRGVEWCCQCAEPCAPHPMGMIDDFTAWSEYGLMACPTFCTSCIVTLLHRLRLREQEGLGATGRRRWWPVA